MSEIDWHAAWVEALDRLELDVERADQMLRANDPEPMPPWEPPALHVSMPEDLLPRARLILERQLVVAEDIARAVTTTQRHRALAARISANNPPEVPVYLDVTA